MLNTDQYGSSYAGIDINFCNAKNITQGSNSVVVAVLDNGVDLDHPDINCLSLSYDPARNAAQLGPYTSYHPTKGRYFSHGTVCAGIISGKNNTIGITGIAPNCPVMSICYPLINLHYSLNLASGFDFARMNGASVISCSWGIEGYYDPVLELAIYNALQNGRGGKGCVVVFSSGNENAPTIDFPKSAHPDIIVVGSMNYNGMRDSGLDGSNYGTKLDIVAPGIEIYTTDYYRENYIDFRIYDQFSGTSVACPHVSAVAALILSVNPNLYQGEVANIIESTAKKVGGYSYQTLISRPNGTWHQEMGYGLVDAYAAVHKAQLLSYGNVVFNNQTVTANTTVPGSTISSQNVTVSNGAKLTLEALSVTINTPFTIDSGSSFILTH